jgi:hypothetical protein
LTHSQTVDFDGEPIVLAPPEYVIVRKLQFYREGGSQKHLRDINRMIAALGDDWENAFLLKQVEAQGLDQEWNLATGFHD